MAKQKHRSESRELINYHRLGNVGQLVVKMNEQMDLIQALLLMDDEERASIREKLEADNEQREQTIREQNNQAGDSSGSDLEQA